MDSLDAFSDTISDKTLSTKALLATEQEVVYSRHGSYKPWKPWTLSSGVLISAAIFTGSIAVVLGILLWQNTRYGALFFASTADDFTLSETFLYRYLPTIIVVLYSLIWSWIDLDIKRLEPWFQLGQNGGASAERSLLLRYPVEFMPLVPFKAAKLRQWTVFSASVIMVLVSWVVVPLQNGIFNSGTILVPNITALNATSSFLPLDEQSAQLGGNILHTAYSVVWLGQAMLPFTTSEFTLAPFEAGQTGDARKANQTLTAATVLFSTVLECRPPAHVTVTESSVTFGDGQGCIAQDLLPTLDGDSTKRFAAYYIGYYDDANVDEDLQLAGCPMNSSHEFLAIWKLSGVSPPNFRNASNATALFCTPKYFSQSVNATVTIPDHKVLYVRPLAPEVQLTEREFNITHFEYLLANGVPDYQPQSPRQDISGTINIHQDSRLQNMSLVVPTANMIGFAVGTTQLEPEEYLNTSNLQMALQRAHQLLFSIAVQAVLRPSSLTVPATGLITSQVQGVSVVPVFAYLSGGCLLLIVIVTACLICATSSRTTALVHDPDSLAQVMSLSRHPDLKSLFMPLDRADDQNITKMLHSQHFEMLPNYEQLPPMINPSSNTKHETIRADFQDSGDGVVQRDFLSDKCLTQPLLYKPIIGVLFLVGLAGTITVLIWLHEKMHSQNGLPPPSHNIVIQQIILNLLPTIVATLMEPVWVLLTRTFCMMQPLEELKAGHVSGRKSLMLKYTALPPQLLSWRALRVGHVLLAALSVVTILANILTVALSGLFTQADVFRSQHIQLAETYQHTTPVGGLDFEVGLYSQYDPFYVAMANFSGVTSLPPWISAEYGFFPVNLTAGRSGTDSTFFELKRMGYGLDLDCQELTESPSDATYNLTFSPNAGLAKFVASYKQPNGSDVLCIPTSALWNQAGTFDGEGYVALNGNPAGLQAFELAEPLTSFKNVYDNPDFALSAPTNAIVDDSSFCNNLIVRGWLRANTTVGQRVVGPATNGSTHATSLPDTVSMTLSKTFISCTPRFKSALFDLRVSESGGIMTATRNSSVTYEQVPSNSSLWMALSQTTSGFAYSHPPVWHNDTFATDWFNNLAKSLTNSTALLDINVPPPNFSVASNITKELYSRLFAIGMSLLTLDLLAAPADSQPIPALQMTSERRVFMSEPLFYISVTILAIDLIVAMVFYWRVPPAFLPRMPTCIANQIAFFAGSHVVDEIGDAGGDLRESDRRGYRYGYGRYVGKDGKVHLGIERHPYLMQPVRQHTVAGRRLCLRKAA